MPNQVLGVDLERMVSTTSRSHILTRVSGDQFDYRFFRDSTFQTIMTEQLAKLETPDRAYELRTAVLDQAEADPIRIFFVVERGATFGREELGQKVRMAFTNRNADSIVAFRAASPLEQFRLLGYN